MEKEYQFPVEKCGGCGRKLSGKRAALAGMKGNVPMGYCPKCQTPYRLVEIEAELKPEPGEESEPGTETKPEPEPGE